MAKKIISNFISSPKKKRKGVHSKSKAAKNKNSRNYLKKYKGQGR